MSDYIDRQQAIDAVGKEPYVADIDGAPTRVYRDVDVMWELYHLPSAQQWIPCSERLPEFPCLVSDANGNMPYVPTGIVTVESKDKGTWAIDASRIDPVQTLNGRTANLFVYGNRIVAWMPLPEPYKGGEQYEK